MAVVKGEEASGFAERRGWRLSLPYPGLPSHPTHATARLLLKGFGTIISFDLRGGTSSPTASAETSGSSDTPPVSGRWNQLRDERPRFRDGGTSRLRSYDSASVSRTQTTSGTISTRQYALPRRAYVDGDAAILPSPVLSPVQNSV